MHFARLLHRRDETIPVNLHLHADARNAAGRGLEFYNAVGRRNFEAATINHITQFLGQSIVSRFFNFKVAFTDRDSKPPNRDTRAEPPDVTSTESLSQAKIANQRLKLERQLLLKNMRILMVEDCPDQQRLLVNILSNYGASVYIECNGEAAAEEAIRAKSVNRPFDAIVMDLYLSSSNGIDATRQIISAVPNTLVIAITAYGSPEIEQEWREAGCSFYLQKPLRIGDLIDALLSGVKATTGK